MEKENNQYAPESERQLRYQQAAEWFMSLCDGDTTDTQVSTWLTWVRTDPRNLEAFERVSRLANSLYALDPKIKATLARELAVVRLGTSLRRFAVRSRRLAFTGLAAAVLAAAVVGYLNFVPGVAAGDDNRTYVTAKGVLRNLVLPDGTRVALGADSTLDVNYTPRARVMDLRSGEAYFQVVHHASRPFVVNAGTVRLQDVGTSFDVSKSGDYVTIAVAQGVVDLTHLDQKGTSSSGGAVKPRPPLSLTAGHGVRVVGGVGQEVTPINVNEVALWREGWLQFQDTPLPVVFANINRYSKREIVIADPKINNMYYTGTVYTSRIDEWLKAVRGVFGLTEVQADGGRHLLLFVAEDRESVEDP